MSAAQFCILIGVIYGVHDRQPWSLVWMTMGVVFSLADLWTEWRKYRAMRKG